MIGLILAGGSGTRFWPLSRKKTPKQFLKIINNQTLIENTINRLKKNIDLKDIYIITTVEQKELVLKNVPYFFSENIILEPMGRNTAPCIGLSIEFLLNKYNENEELLIVPADHYIEPEEKFWETINKGLLLAKNNYLVTFGIIPHYPATGYGYIELDKEIKKDMFHVKQFKEKPNLDLAKHFFKQDNFLWNSGIFLWKLRIIKDEFKKHLPTLYKKLVLINELWKKNNFNLDISKEYSFMPKIPIDIGIMEQSNITAIVKANFNWNDVGSFKSIYDLKNKDENNNVLETKTISLNSKNNYIKSKKTIALIDVNNIAVIETDDVILISDINETEKVKQLVEIIKKNNKELL